MDVDPLYICVFSIINQFFVVVYMYAWKSKYLTLYSQNWNK